MLLRVLLAVYDHISAYRACRRSQEACTLMALCASGSEQQAGLHGCLSPKLIECDRFLDTSASNIG